MPDRSREDYEKIYYDLLRIRKIANELAEKGSFKNTWFNGESGGSEKKKFFQHFVDRWEELLVSGELRTCECIDLVKSTIKFWKKERDSKFNPLRPGASHRNSSNWKIYDLTLDDLIAETKKGYQGRRMNKVTDETLDKLGNCNIVQACNDTLLKEAKNLMFDSENIIFSEQTGKLQTNKTCQRF